jgi:hypothetical protein
MYKKVKHRMSHITVEKCIIRPEKKTHPFNVKVLKKN